MNLSDMKKNFVLLEQNEIGTLLYNDYEKISKQMFLFINNKGICRTFTSDYSILTSTIHNKQTTITSAIDLDYCLRLFNIN